MTEESDMRMQNELVNPALARDSESALARPPQLSLNEVFAAYAEKAMLLRGEAVAILQGRAPPVPRFEDECIYFTEEHMGVIQRFLGDAERGDVRSPCQPAELVAWAESVRVVLPKAFADVVHARQVANRGGNTGDYAFGPDLDPFATDREEADQAHQIQTAAYDGALELRKKLGRWPTKEEVAKKIHQDYGRSAARVVRLIRNTWKPDGRSKGARLKGVCPNRRTRP